VLLAATEYAMLPDPVPLAGEDVIVIHGVLVVAVQPHEGIVVIVTEPVPPAMLTVG
jgi:hypothetical protein